MGNKSMLIRIALLFGLLIISNLYLFRPGLWLFQDAAYWPKTAHEAFILVNQQLHSFTNYGYYLGFDQGFFNFTRIEVNLLINLLFWLFGSEGSQVALSVLGSLASFIAIYLMTKIFFVSKNIRFTISLLYVFNPLMYSLQGHTYYGIAVPLFLYSFYEWFRTNSKGRLVYLLLNIISVFFWVAYIRFIPIYAIIILPYVIYLAISKQIKFPLKSTFQYFVSYLLILSPIILSFVRQLTEGASTAFNYRNVYGFTISQKDFIHAFNPFVNIGANLYNHPIYPIIGLLLSILIVWLIWTYKSENNSKLWLINLSLILFAITCFGLANIFGSSGYKTLINIIPFVINGPFFAFYISSIPYVLLLGKLTENRTRYLYIFTVVFIVIGFIPLLDFKSIELRQTDLNQVPISYKQYFIDNYHYQPQATLYTYSTCWRAQYMNDQNIPTSCLNFGLQYSSITLDDPRLVSGLAYKFATEIIENNQFDNLRITHNLKNIIIPKDIVLKNGPGSATQISDLDSLPIINATLFQNQKLTPKLNDNFNNFEYKDSKEYDFLLYAPQTILSVDRNQWLTSPINIESVPVLVAKSENMTKSSLAAPTIWYKANPDNPTIYYLRVSNITPQQPFELQLNQTYHRSWQVKAISKADFEQVDCNQDWTHYSITNNFSCLYKYKLLDLNHLKFILSPPITSVHQLGNILNNRWTVNFPDDEVYLVITFQKQELYTITILLSFGFIIILVLGILIQEITRKLIHD